MTPRATTRPPRSTISFVAAGVVAAVVGVLGHPASVVPGAARPAPGAQPPGKAARPQAGIPRPDPPPGAALGAADGVVTGGVTVFDDRVPAVGHLDPDLRTALRRAATDAGDDGVAFSVNSGWRSRAYQDQLLREAIAKYGSRAAAARWVATPDTSPHVSGQAVDIGPADAETWLSRRGAHYGLCQIYRNEPWHYELRRADHGCPPPYADPTHDPRMQR